MTPSVSVALCTYNGASTLPAQLESLASQSERNLEIVACDDASSDSTLAVLQAFATRDPRLRVTANAHTLGYSQNFASAFGQCRGELIAPCDQDDVWRADKLAVLAGALGAADLAYCDSEIVDGRGQSLHRRLSHTRRMYQGTEPLALVATNSASGHAMLFRRELLARALPIPSGLHYDWWLALVAAAGKGIRYVDQPLVRFRRHDAATTGIARSAARPHWRDWLAGRRTLLRALSQIDGARRGDALALAQALDDGLERGRWGASIRLAWRYRDPLTSILGPGVAAFAWRAAVGRCRPVV